MSRIQVSLLLGSVAVLMSACAPETGGSADVTDAFPSGLAVTSPTGYQTTPAPAGIYTTQSVGSYSSDYELDVADIDAMLSATSSSSCGFDPQDFMAQETNAACYGPIIAYQNHPDGTDGAGSPPTLPGGDVGMWLASDATTGNACAADQLDSRMSGMSRRAGASLKGLASMVCAAVTNGRSLPAAGGSLDLVTEMNGLGVTDTTFTTATLNHSTDGSGNDVYAYTLAFTYAPSPNSYDISVSMSHTPDSSTSGVFNGRMTYYINDAANNNPRCTHGGASGTADNASLVYDKTASAMNIEMRSARYCGGDDGLNASNVLDPTPYNDASYTGGWTDNFNKLTANFSTSDLSGDYVYAWQAGNGDSNSRVFNAHVSTSSSIPTIEAFFGFGNAMDSFSGNIEGMICNWAGPGNSHTPVNYVQHQVATFNSATGVFEVDVLHSELVYAPTNTCDSSGSFIFDANGDGTLDTGTSEGNTVMNGMAAVTDAGGDGVFDEIAAVVSNPSSPTYP